MITMIACVDINNGIGNSEGGLLFKIEEDLKHFKSVTSGKIVVMGRKTWVSLPKKPLEKRKNYILTRDKSFQPIGAKVVHSVEEVLKLSKKNDVFIIGGGEVYELFLEYADKIILTHVHTTHPDVAVKFPEISPKEWKIKSSQHHTIDDPFRLLDSYSFTYYEKKQIKKDGK